MKRFLKDGAPQPKIVGNRLVFGMILVVYVPYRPWEVSSGRGSFFFSPNQFFFGRVLELLNRETSENMWCISIVARVSVFRAVLLARCLIISVSPFSECDTPGIPSQPCPVGVA